MKYGVQAIFDHFTQRTDFTFCFIFNVFGSNTSQSFCNVTVCRVFLGDFEEVSDFVECFMNVSLVYLGNSALLLLFVGCCYLHFAEKLYFREALPPKSKDYTPGTLAHAEPYFPDVRHITSRWRVSRRFFAARFRDVIGIFFFVFTGRELWRGRGS